MTAKINRTFFEELNRLGRSVRFWAMVKCGSSDECWPWQGKLGRGKSKKYGDFAAGKKRQGVHRIAWMLGNGADILAGLCACHRCDNPPCCNPGHLFLGTHMENMLDAMAKGIIEPRKPRPEPAMQRRVTDDEEMDMRAKYFKAGKTQRAIAEEYKISQSVISRICHGRTNHPKDGSMPQARKTRTDKGRRRGAYRARGGVKNYMVEPL